MKKKKLKKQAKRRWKAIQKIAKRTEIINGVLYWINDTKISYHRVAGKPVGSVNSKGYLQAGIQVNGRSVTVKVHRVVFYKYYGFLPPVLDHINLLKTDNRIENLREATPSQNVRNQTKRMGCTSQYIGVHRSKNNAQNPWRSMIGLNGRCVYLGYYQTEIEAHEARVAATIHYGVEEYTDRTSKQ